MHFVFFYDNVIASRCIIILAGTALRKNDGARIVFWADQHVGIKFIVFVWEPDCKKSISKINFEKFMKEKLKMIK